MSDVITARRILERWHVNIKTPDKKAANMPPLFDAVANELFCAGVAFDTAEDAMREAAKLMYPSSEIVRNFHKKDNRGQTVLEMTRSWQASLDKAAMEAFYAYFNIEGIDHTKVPSVKKIDPKIKSGASDNDVDVINREDFWKSVKIVSKENPWLFDDEESTGE